MYYEILHLLEHSIVDTTFSFKKLTTLIVSVKSTKSGRCWQACQIGLTINDVLMCNLGALKKKQKKSTAAQIERRSIHSRETIESDDLAGLAPRGAS